MVKIVNENPLKVNDTAFWFDSWGVLRTGTIYEIRNTRMGIQEPKTVAMIKGPECGSTGAELSICWPTREACLKAENKRSRLQKAEYKASIETVHDLVKFLYENDINSECRDYEAAAAAKERAAELGVPVE